MRLGRRDVIGAIVALAVAIVCVRLGIWQLDRLGQRRARNAVLTARLALPPLEVVQGTPPDSARQRRLIARGVYDYAGELIGPGRSFDGTPGVALVTPLRLGDGSTVFVDRGWVPSPDARHVDQRLYRESDTATVAGLGVIPPPGRYDVPFILQQSGTAAPRGLPRRWPGPALDDGPHLSYAIQWFSFAVIIVLGTGALLRKTTILGPS
jgi:surfeit locus 1 family protein